MLVVWILLGIIGVLTLLSIIAPKSFQVERSKIINVSAEKAFNSLKSLKEAKKWSPWFKKDPNQQLTYQGTDGTVGSISKWEGNKEVGIGEQEITQLQPYSYIQSELRFLKPWKSVSTGYYKIHELNPHSIEVSWGFKGKAPFPMNVMFLFMNMDKMMGKDFEKGMDDFKTYIEGKP